MKLPYNSIHMIMLTLSTYVVLNALFIPLSYGSPQTLRHTHFQNNAIFRHIAATQASSEDSNDILLSTTPHWLNQTLDHFSPQDYPKFPQRYFEFSDYFDAPHGPIFLTICGESTCPGIINDYVGVLAERFGAAIVALEHRYYGYSSPFADLETKNLKYLNSKQALSDLATFRNHYQDLINQRYNLPSTTDNPWITFGGSYAGALSAWFRLKFPHLTRGSVASSAVVHAIQDFYAYDQQVAKTVGPRCTRALQAVQAAVNYQMAKNATHLKSMFYAESIKEDADFLSLLADSTALAVQYGFQDLLCKPLVQTFRARRNVLVAYQNYFKNVIYYGLGINPLDYNREFIKNSTMDAPTSAESRLWTYQFCTEFGFLQTAPAKNSIRSPQLNSKYFLDLCSYIFGEDIRPSPDATNLYYGGDEIAGSKILFTNGSQDPWRHASKQVWTRDEPVIVIKCQNCAHCVDLSGCPQFPLNPQGDASLCKPRDTIDKARALTAEYIELWIKH